MAKKINDNSENESTIDILEQAKNINQQTHNYIDWNQKTGHMLSDKSFGDTETLENDWGSFGQSSHDNTSFNPNYKSGDLNEMRAADQGFVEKVGLGAAKMTTTAATTFLDNTVGFLWGIVDAGIKGDGSRIWDNDFTNAMQDFNDYIEKEMPHYSSQYEGWGMDFWGNFIGKDILQNAGFQVGTGLSMIVPGGILKGGANAAKGVKALSNFMKTGKAIRTGNAAKDLVMGTYAAIGESTIEALNNKRDFVKYQEQVADDDFRQKQQELDFEWRQIVNEKYNGDVEAARRSMDFNDYFNKSQELKAERQQKQQFITQEADKVGDMTFLANLAICGGTNFLTFGKSFWGYNQSKRFADGMATDIVEKGTNNVLKKNVSESTAKKAIKEGFIEVKNPNYGKMVQNAEGKWVKDTQKTIKKAVETNTRAVSKSPLANTLRTFAEEGNQEMIQQVASDYSTDIAETDMLNYEALAKDGLAYDEILKRLNDTWFDYGKMCQAFKKVYTDPQQWRQFFGGAIGVGLSPHFTKGADGKLKFHLNNIGAQNAAIREQNSINALIAEDINKIINSPESQNYLTGLLRHTALDRVKQNAVTADDKMEYENADFAQFVSDITTLSNAGKLEFLSAHLEGMRNMTDEDLKKTCMNMCTTNKNGKVVGDFVDTNGNFIGDSEEGMRKVREKLNRRIDRLQKDISLYQRTMNEIDGQTNGVLDHETLAAFTWEKAQLMNKYARAKEIIGGEKSVKNIGIYKNKITANLTDFTNKLNSTKESLKQEKERLSRVPKVEGKPVEASELQKKYEADIENLTRQINIATEVSQLLTDMEALQVNNSDHNDDKSAIQQLFDKYSDMIGKMPEFAKMQGLVDENGNRIKKKNKKGEVIKNEDGTDKVASLSLEDIMATGLFDKVMQEYADVDPKTVNDMSGDYSDAAKLHFRAKETEKGLDELVNNPEQFTAHRAALQQRILERENDKTITKLTKAIQKGIDEGRITLDNLEEESKKIAEAIENDETTKTRRLFDRMVSSLNTTPYDELRKIAINRVLKDKKNKDFAQIRDLINYVYLNIVMNNNLSDKAKEIAMQTFNNAIKGKKNIEEIHNTKITINNVNVNSLLVEESAGDKLLKQQRIERGEQNLPYNSANYIYTEKSYAEAKIAQNEIPQIINSAVDKFYNSRNSSKLSDQLGNIDESAVNAGTESAKVKKDIADKKKAVEDKINELLKTFKDGEVLSEAEKDKLVDDVNKIIDKTLNDEEYKEEYRQEVSDANIELKRLAIDLIEKNVLNRISDNYKKQDKDIEAEVYLDKAIDAVNKKIQKIQRELERKSDNEAFNDVFDDIAKDDSSEEPKNSIEGYYYENGNVYRGHFVHCNSLLTGRKCYAVAERIDKNLYSWKIIDNHGAVIGTISTNELLEPEKRGDSISFDFSNLVTFTPDAFSLQRFSQLGILVEPKPITNAENRKRKAKRKKVNQVFRDNGTIDNKGNVNLQNNLIQSVITSNVIFDNDLTSSQENQVISSANILTSPVELTPTTVQSAENLTPTTIESADNLTPTTIERVDYNAPNLVEEEKTQLQSVRQKQVQARRTVSRLDAQLSELNNMLNRLQDAAKQNPQYHETLRTVDTFKQYIEFIRSNYESLGKPRNVVLDSNTMQTIMDNLRNNMRKIFGDDVTFANDADMQRLADEAKDKQMSVESISDYTDEMQSIKDKAIADGTFMKAPNGKPTNLNERQWLQVRTKAFKEWFGDWEKEAKFSYNLYKESGDRFLSEKERNKVIQDYNNGNDIVVYAASDDVKSLLKGNDFRKSSKGYDINTQDGILYTSFTLNYAKNYADIYANQGRDIEKIGLVKITLNKNNINNGVSFTDSEVRITSNDVIKNIEEINETKNLNKIQIHTRNWKNVSKVVDDNGEPLVVYHYTDNENLNEFSVNFDNYFAQTGGTKKAIFFTEDKVEKGEEDNFLTQRKARKSVFLNIKDLKTYNGTKEDLHEKGTSYREVVNKSAEENDIDGGVHMSGFDDNKKTNQDIWIIHNPNQVKSATDNVGTFSRENDDIRFEKSNGETYGFTNEGKVVINKDKFRLDTPVHEYTHLWDKACMEHSPELWKRGVELMKQHPEWQKVIEDDNYANIKGNEDLVASEVHSRLSGMLAAGKAIQFAGRKNNKGFWAKLLNWFKEFKDFTLRHVFGMSKEDAQKVTLQQFLSAPVADFFMQTDPRNIGITDYVKPKATQKTSTTNKEHKVKVGDTIQYQGIAKKATVTSVSDKGISIKTEDGKEYKNVDAKYIDFLYGSKPSSNAKYNDIENEDAVSPEEFIARELVCIKINDTKNDITNLDKKLASKKGKTIDELVLAIKDEIPFRISDDEIKNHIIDISSGRTIDAIKQYAVDAHYEAEDKAWEAERSRIESELEGGINPIITNEEDISEAEYADWLDSPFEEDALRYELDRQFAEEESERTYNDVQYQLAQEAALAEQSGFDPIALFVEEELARLKQQVPPVKLDIVNDDADTKLARESGNNAKAEIQSEPIDTFKPGISEFNINDKTQTFINPKNEKGFRYIYDLYKATGAFDYVKNGNLRAGDEVQIAYGKIGENAETNKPIYGVVFLVKDSNGNYQMIGTMSETKKSDPQTATVLRQELDKFAKNSKNYQVVSVNNNNSTNTFGSSNISFKLMLNNGKPITTTISKVLNGSLLNSQTRHSLKDVILPNGGTVGNAVKNGENNLAIAFYDSKLQSVGNANFTVDDVQLEAMKAFKNKGSKHKGHVVLMVDKPDGRKQLIPLRVATLGDLINKPNNAIVNNIKEVIGKLHDIYSSKSTIGKKNRDMFEYLVMLDQYLYDSTKFGTKIYFNAGNAIAIEAGNNDRIVLKNEDGSPISRENFENEVLKQLSSFFINVDEKSLERPEVLNSYIMNDVFTTYLVETTHRNSHFTVNPINAAGERLKVEKDTPEQKILKSYGIQEVIGTVGQTDLFDVVVVKDLKGNYGIYEKIVNTYKRSDAISNYSTIQQFCMVAYAKLKKGIEAETYSILSNGYTKDLNGKLQGPKELLVHKTELGDTYIYDTESFNRIDNNNVYTVDDEGNEHNFVNDKVETKSDKDLSLDSKKVRNTLDKGKKAAKPKKQVKSSNKLPALFFDKNFANTLLSLPTPKAITQFFENVDMQDFVDEINGNESIVGPYKRMVEFLKSNLSKEQLETMVDTLKEYNNNVFEVYTNYIKSQSQNLGVSIDEALSSAGLFKLIESTKKPDNIKTAFEKEDETCAI